MHTNDAPPPSEGNTLAARAHLEIARLREDNQRLTLELLEARQDLGQAIGLNLTMADGWRREIGRSRRLEEELAVLRVAALAPELVHGNAGEAPADRFMDDRPDFAVLDDRD